MMSVPLVALAVFLISAAGFMRWVLVRRHRRHDSRRPGPLLRVLPGVPSPDGPYGTESIASFPSASSTTSVEDVGTLASLLIEDRAGFEFCPTEGRTTAHFLHSDGSRTCCWCETKTEGEQPCP